MSPATAATHRARTVRIGTGGLPTSRPAQVTIRIEPSEDAVLLAVELGASSDYQTLVLGGADIELKHESGLDVRIWSPDGLVEMNEAHQVQTRLGSGLAVGDADGRCLVERPDGIFAVGWGATDPSELRLVTPDLNSMLNGELGVLSPSG